MNSRSTILDTSSRFFSATLHSVWDLLSLGLFSAAMNLSAVGLVDSFMHGHRVKSVIGGLLFVAGMRCIFEFVCMSGEMALYSYSSFRLRIFKVVKSMINVCVGGFGIYLVILTIRNIYVVK